MDEPQVGCAQVSLNVDGGKHETAVVEPGTELQGCRVEVLEVEDEDTRIKRLHSMFKRINSGSSSSPGPSLQFNFGEYKTWAVEPPSELLSRIQAFLPQIEASNAILTQRVETDPSSVDVEHLEDNSERYIEMNLSLGVFDIKPAGQSLDDQDTEMTDSSSTSSSSSCLSSSSSSSLTSSSSDSDSDDTDSESELDSEEILSSCIPSSFLSRSPPSIGQSSDLTGSNGKMKAPRLMRPLPRRSGSSASQPRPSIIVLNETLNESSME
ncbi:hypothetical protein J3R30DRAFT_3337225 [Lentinula aciculospora]|uniref:Uncharacterized protein n=1 Tax=Lentinula aciculospora TaxID=153920 RepID=A0A9W9A5G1_9AGAR|nr:hypothetical protein J3R30DRAFT_3337225 [Lentinula aciculospora]